MIGDSIAYCKNQDKEIIYDAEHFFDGYKANPEYAFGNCANRSGQRRRLCRLV